MVEAAGGRDHGCEAIVSIGYDSTKWWKLSFISVIVRFRETLNPKPLAQL